MRLSTITTVLISAGVMVGCASNKPFAGMQVVPHTSTQHGVKTAAGYYALARYFHGSSRLAEAEKAYGDALRLQPAHVDALAGLGMVRSEQGRHVEAIALLKSAAVRAPRSTTVLNNLGYALMAGGDPKQAVIELNKALAVAPRNMRIQNNLKRAHEAAGKVPTNSLPGKSSVAGESTGEKVTQTASSPKESAGFTPAPLPGPVPSLQAAPSKPVDVNPLPTELQTNVVRIAPAIFSVEYGVPTADNKTANIPVNSWAQVAAATSLPVQVPQTSVTTLASVHKSAIGVKPALVAASTNKSDVCEGLGMKPEGKIRLEVQNGNGTTGMAKTVGFQLANHDVKLVRLTNKTPFDVPRTIVEFSKGKQAEACSLAARFSLDAPRESHQLSPNVDVRLVLGRDLRQADALLSRSQDTLAMSQNRELR